MKTHRCPQLLWRLVKFLQYEPDYYVIVGNYKHNFQSCLPCSQLKAP